MIFSLNYNKLNDHQQLTAKEPILMLVLVSHPVVAEDQELKFKATIVGISQQIGNDSAIIASLFTDSSNFDFTITVDVDTN